MQIFHLIAYAIAGHIAVLVVSDVIDQRRIFLTSDFVKDNFFHSYR